MSGQRTEDPTPKRRQEARRKGEGVGRSHEFSMALTLGVSVLGLSSLLPGISAAIADSLRKAILEVGQPGLTTALMVERFGGGIGQAIGLILPLAFLVMGAGIAASIVSGGLIFSTASMKFDLKKLNPMTGMKRIVDKQAFMRLGIASAKLVLLAFVSWQVVGGRVPALVGLGGASAAAIAGGALDAMFQLGLTMTVLLTIVALVDFVIQRRKAKGQLKMTKEDVKREFKESEGNPQIQALRRRRARQMAFSRMMDAVPTADVIVTNPIHLAVALKYDSLTMGAPRLVAKGQRLMAERIKAIARANNVPVVEDVPLARALFPQKLGSEVPAHLYRAVARILVIVQQTRFSSRRPTGGAPRPRPVSGTDRAWPGRRDTQGADR